MTEFVRSGIHALGDVKLGTHFCHFYEGQKDLVDTLVPYFKAGLENNERCLWVTSQPLLAHEARSLLADAVPNLADLEAKGQIEIYNHADWYLRTGTASSDDTMSLWVDRCSDALEKGYTGLRLTGNTAWLERTDWEAFTSYEQLVNETFGKHRIVGLCSYCLGKTGSTDVFDVVRNHDFTLLRKDGDWELLESASVKKSKVTLDKLNQGLKENLRRALDEAKSASRLKSEFLANITHEIRTPLNAILGFADLLKGDDLERQDRQEFLETIERNGVALSRLVDDVLDIAKIEAGRLEIETVAFRPLDLVDDVVGLFARTVRQKGVELRVERPCDLPRIVRSDPTRIRQILVNLVGNAVKFTERGEIVLRVSSRFVGGRDVLRFEVSDTGEGIASAVQSDLFQPFKQADGSTTRRFGGTGLGLYLSRRLALALDGDVRLASSDRGVGSTFVAEIKVQVDSAEATATATRNSAAQGELNGLRVLVVEDMPDNRRLVAHLLRRAGATFTLSVDGQDGLEAAAKDDFDVVLMDLQMPRLDGYEAASALRARGYRKPIVALTAHAMADEHVRILSSGFDEHVSKPIDGRRLVSLLKSYRATADVTAP